MPDLGRWFGMDKLSETYASTSPYAYVMNNPISHLDPDGRYADNWLQDIWDNTKSSSTWTNNDDGTFSGKENKGSDPGKGLFQSIGAFFGNIFGNIFGSARRDAQITTVKSGAQVMYVGELERVSMSYGAEAGTAEGAAALEAGMTTAEAEAIVARSLSNIMGAGVWTLPLILNGDAAKTDDKIPSITLYRGVSSKAKGTMYFEAMQGIAIPNGFRQVSSMWGPHSDMDLHSMGDNYSIWTSWSSDREMAKNFATGVAFGKAVPGIIMSRTFNLSEIVPNISQTAYNAQESEWLVPGVVYGARVQYVLPRPGQ